MPAWRELQTVADGPPPVDRRSVVVGTPSVTEAARYRPVGGKRRNEAEMTETDARTHDIGAAGDAFFSAEDLKNHMRQRQIAEFAKQQAREQERAQAQAEQIKQLMVPIEVTKERVEQFMQRVRKAAENGEHQILILRFPSDMCSDRGRAINNVLLGWEDTLVGVPKQVLQVWQDNLRSLGFVLSAEVLDYPHGMPGDIGLFCRW